MFKTNSRKEIKSRAARNIIFSNISKEQKKEILKFEKDNNCILVGCMESDEEFHFVDKDGLSYFLFSLKLQKELEQLNDK